MVYAWVKDMPRSASLSRVGVLMCGLPQAAMQSGRKSSARMKRTLGLAALAATKAALPTEKLMQARTGRALKPMNGLCALFIVICSQGMLHNPPTGCTEKRTVRLPSALVRPQSLRHRLAIYFRGDARLWKIGKPQA